MSGARSSRLSIDTNDGPDATDFSMPVDAYVAQSELAVPAYVRVISGCKDSELAADVGSTKKFDVVRVLQVNFPQASLMTTTRQIENPDGAGGACTSALLASIEHAEDSAELTWSELLRRMNLKLSEYNIRQQVQMSCSRRLDLSLHPFSVLNPLHVPKTSKTRALIVGINYAGSSSDLKGCINDASAVREFLIREGFGPDQVRILADDDHVDTVPPTYDNILEGIRWLVKDVTKHDSLFFHFSGHVSAVKDDNGDEKDNQDEAIVPVDFDSKGVLLDDTLLQELVLPLPVDAYLTCLVDCCHSGTIVDLPFSLVIPKEETSSTRSLILAQNPSFSFRNALRYGMGVSVTPKGSGLENLQKFAQDLKCTIPVAM